MCLTCNCNPCDTDCPTNSLSASQSAMYNFIKQLGVANGFDVYLSVDEGDMMHLCVTDDMSGNWSGLNNEFPILE